MTWLITGGAGYIGSHIVRAFEAAGHDVVILDDFSSGHRSFVSPSATVIEGSILDRTALDKAFAFGIDGVVHVAGYKYAGESVQRPLHCYQQNVSGTVEVLDAMVRHGVSNIVFSSSAAVYGTPDVDQVTEQTSTNPESPYGESKLIGEWLLNDAEKAYGMHHTSLRYFNVVGSGDVSLRDTSPFNLIPLIFRALSSGKVPHINGDDYPTSDGTCVRDYVHVSDIAQAHVAAAEALSAGKKLDPVYNLGAGAGTSVAEIMSIASLVSGREFTPEIKPRRPGDPARIVASGERAAEDLGWENRFSLEEMIGSAWAAEQHAQKANQ